jgi:hypothetical protein
LDWFLKSRRYVEQSGAPWFILSAEYGLVPPDNRDHQAGMLHLI